MRSIHCAFAVCLLGFVIVKSAAMAAPAYKVTVLNPPAGFGGAESSSISGASQVGAGIPLDCFFCQHALLWNGTSESVVDLHPFGFSSSHALGVSGANQVGWGAGPPAPEMHALLWNGTAESVVDLHPNGFEYTQAVDVSGASQVGIGAGPATGGNNHALLWTGTAASVVDLHPAGFSYSEARGVSAASQVGVGAGPATGGNERALLWSGTAESVVNLHPAGLAGSAANAVSGASQVGWGDGHALLWHGTAESVVDLHPIGFEHSFAYGVSEAGQVGYGVNFSIPNALLWNGTAASVADLHSYVVEQLGPDFYWSAAYGIADNGTIVGHAVGTVSGFAVLWTPIPEPSSLALVTLAIPALLRRRRTRQYYIPPVSPSPRRALNSKRPVCSATLAAPGNFQGDELMRSMHCAYAALLLSVSAASATAAPPNIYNLGTLGGGSNADAINNAGQVTGRAIQVAGASNHAFLYTGTPGSGGMMHDLGTLGGSSSSGSGINDNGQIAGYSRMTGNANSHAFLYTGTPGVDGMMHDLGTLGGTHSYGYGINNSGQIVGESLPLGHLIYYHAFLYTGTPGVDGMMHDLGTLGGFASIAYAINNAAQVTGSSQVAAGDTSRYAFLYTGTPGIDGVMHNLSPTGVESEGYAINDRGQVTGRYDEEVTEFLSLPRAFLYTGTPGVDGTMLDLGIYGIGAAINNHGQIVGGTCVFDGPECVTLSGYPFLYTGTPGIDGVLIDLNDWLDANNPVEGPKWWLGYASGINDNGLITGYGEYDDGPGGLSDGTRAFLLDASSLLPPDLPGDFNFDGSVDAADYVVWRKTDGTPDGYNTWRGNFGRTSGSELAAGENSVPEPGSLALPTLAAPALLRRRQAPAAGKVRLRKPIC